MRIARLLPLLAVTIVAACGDQRPSTGPSSPGAPAFGFSDGSRSGNENFFFLPPLARNPSGHENFDADAFNASLRPVVEICELAAPALTSCVAGAPVRSFSGAEVEVSVSEQQYKVNWDTGADALNPLSYYRIRVLVAGIELGFADLDPVSSARELRVVQTNEYVGLVDGRTLPIKFRIERGALVQTDGDCPDCAETVVGNEGGTYQLDVDGDNQPETGTVVLTNTGFAGAFFPDGWLDGVTLPPGSNGEVVVAIERTAVDPTNNCHGAQGAGLLQFEGCYHYQLYAGGTAIDPTFATTVVVGQCIEISASNPLYDNLALHKSDVEEPLELLEEAYAPFVTGCENMSGTPGPIGMGPLDRLGRGVLALANFVGRSISPQSLYAVDQGLGGKLDAFSDIGWAVARQLDLVAGDAQTAVITSMLPINPRVLVRAGHGDPTPLAGVPVKFEIISGGGSLGPPAAAALSTVTVISDATGHAEVPVVVRATPGAMVLQASVAAADGPPVTFNVTAISGIGGLGGAAIADTIFMARFTGDAVGSSPGAPTVGSLSGSDTDGSIIVRAAVGDVAGQPVEIATLGAAAGAPLLAGTVAGAAPTSGQWTVRWRSVVSGSAVQAVNVIVRSATGSNIAAVAYGAPAPTTSGPLFYNGSTTASGIWWEDEGQLFELVVDLDAQMTTLRVDGMLVTPDPVPFLQGATTLSQVVMDFGGTDAQKLGWDDILIYRSGAGGVALAPARAGVAVGGSQGFTGSARDAGGGLVPSSFTWATSNPTVASINAAGVATGFAPGLVSILGTANATGNLGSAALCVGGTPCPVSPADQSVFGHFPRVTTLTWTPIANASSYEVEVQFGNGCTSGPITCATWTGGPTTTGASFYNFGFVGAQPGRWRVRAITPAGPTPWSAYTHFEYSI